MVVACPKCKTRLNIPEERLKPEGSKFKCPKCSAILTVKKPAAQARKLNRNRVIVAHERPDVLGTMESALQGAGFQTVRAGDGVDVLAKVLRELPAVVAVDAALPQIHGFEIARRIKGRKDIEGMKVVLVYSKTDPSREPKQPASAYGVDEYADDSDLSAGLVDAVQFALGIKKKEAPRPAAPAAAPGPRPAAAAARAGATSGVEKAKRLARTVLSDIELYSPDKVKDAIRAGNFEAVFAEELREGLKHYESRIPAEVRNEGNFFHEALDEFINRKRKSLGL